MDEQLQIPVCDIWLFEDSQSVEDSNNLTSLIEEINTDIEASFFDYDIRSEKKPRLLPLNNFTKRDFKLLCEYMGYDYAEPFTASGKNGFKFYYSKKEWE